MVPFISVLDRGGRGGRPSYVTSRGTRIMQPSRTEFVTREMIPKREEHLRADPELAI